MKKHTGLILLGGGIDSTTLLVDLVKQGYKLHAIFFCYGQKAGIQEQVSCQMFCATYGVPLKSVHIGINLIASCSIMDGKPVGKSAKNNVLIGRNAIFLSMAVTYACTLGIKDIYVGFHDEPINSQFEDAKQDFVDSFNTYIYSYLPRKYQGMQVHSPYWLMTREEILAKAMELDKDIVRDAWTCYEDGPEECGECVHCKKKKSMMKKLGIKLCAE